MLQNFETAQQKRELPEFGPGDTVVVNVKVKEGNRERVQAYEGVVIAKKNAGLNSSFTVRRISHGYGVERVFQTHSATIDS
ncbi:50S ribosomal protein L19, partial [Acinetobacter baumannii]